MLDFVIGRKAKPAAADNLMESLRRLVVDEGIVYIGYPIVATESETSTIDALFTSRQHGVVVFDLLEGAPKEGEWEEIEERQGRLGAALTSRLLLHRNLRKGSRLAFNVNVVTYSPVPAEASPDLEILIASPWNLSKVLADLQPLPEELLVPLNAALQSVSTIKPRKKRVSVRSPSSRGAILKEIERNIANLDQWQRRAAIEMPEGPQRVRGIAGSGKTVVLALKAAYLHAQHPDWTIGVTFQTRSLYQQFRDFIRRFFFDQQRDEPDWMKLLVLHAWGSAFEPGVYARIAMAIGQRPQNFATARQRHGLAKAFEGVCAELLEEVEGHQIEPLFDALLIDEAQDFPIPFFELAYHATKEPKRIVWAYDELQNLGNYSMPPPEVLFGSNPRGKPRVALRNLADAPHQDIILPVCYRNTPWALATAHALGFGVYRKEGGLCQFFDDPGLFQDIGYEVVSGSWRPGDSIALARRPNCSPKFFEELLAPEDSVQARVFETRKDQIAWVVDSIQRNLQQDELEPDDILVIFPNPITAASEAGPLIAALRARGISSHLVGVTSSKDEIFAPGSIAISGIRRAKGNEAPMVYLLNSEHCVSRLEPATKRNILFTGVTRSRAWVRVCGVGPGMEALDEEMRTVAKRGFRLEFRVPTDEELANMRRIHRDMTTDEKRLVSETEETLEQFLERVEAGDLSLEHLAPELRAKLRAALKADDNA